MTLPSTTPKEIKLGNDSTVVWSFTFIINKAADLLVTHTDSAGVETVIPEGTGTSNYSLSVTSYPGNGSVTYPATLGTELATGDTLTLSRSVVIEQQTDLKNQGDYSPTVVESALDYGRMVDLQQQDELDRSLKFAISADLTSFNNDIPAPVANKTIVINSAGTGWELTDSPAASALAAAASAAAASASETSAAADAVSTAADAVSTAADAAAAQASATAAAISAASNLFARMTDIASADSPVNVEISADGTLYPTTMDGNVDYSLPAIGADEGIRFGFLRVGASNVLTLVRDGTDTINGVAGNYTIATNDGELTVIFADDASPDNWIVTVWTQAAAGEGLTKSGSVLSTKPIVVGSIAIGDETTAIAAGTSIVTFHSPIALTLTNIVAGLTTAQTSGSVLTFDINEAGTSILSTKLTVDNGEDTSTTAATPPVLSDTSLAAGSKLTVDIDQIGDGTAVGGKIYFIGRPS